MQAEMTLCEICTGDNYTPYGQGHCTGCHQTWSGLAVCHCSLCHLTFGSISGFDAHLVGEVDTRHHRTPDEMAQIGYLPNARGHLTNQSRMARLRAARAWKAPLAPKLT